MTEEDETKPTAEVNPDALEAVFAEEEVLIEDEVFLTVAEDDEDDAVDIAFQANDEGYW